MTREEARYNRIVKKHDKKLFVTTNRISKVLEVYRENYTPETYDISGITGEPNCYLTGILPNHHYIMSLTDTWTVFGNPTFYGETYLLDRLGFIDTWKSDSMANQMEKHNEKIDQSSKRAFNNEVEAFTHDFRNDFKKTFSDVNTSSMEKIDKRKINEEKI